MGTSYGGEAAMKFAFLYPEMTRSISVIDSVSELDEVCKGFVVGWKVLCDTGDGETFFWGMAPSIYGPEFLANNQEMLAGRAKAIKDNPNGYLEGQKTLYDTFAQDVYMTDELSKIFLSPPSSQKFWRTIFLTRSTSRFRTVAMYQFLKSPRSWRVPFLAL